MASIAPINHARYTLFSRCLDQFDKLRTEGLLFYNDTEAETLVDSGYTLQFRIVDSFVKKPWPTKNITSSVAKPDPFGNPEREFVVDEIQDYLIQLNKFCAVRPQLLLHPKNYAPQTDPLKLADYDAILRIFQDLRDPSFVAFYNCGPESGSSQPYKHIQIIPKPHEDEFILFPDSPQMEAEFRRQNHSEFCKPPTDLGVPFLCLVSHVHESEAEIIYDRYVKMLSSLSKQLNLHILAHNVIMTRDWICVVPRRRAGSDQCAANSMGMMGMIWTATNQERNAWNDLGISKHLTTLGFPPEVGI